MKPFITSHLNRVLTLILTIIALVMGQNTWAKTIWTVTNDNGDSNTFTITRSEYSQAQTVHFRTVSLSAYASQHFTAVDKDYTFKAGVQSANFTVTELIPTDISYMYQTNDKRQYKFEVTDRGGFTLASAIRNMTTGTKFVTDYLNKKVTDLVYFDNNGAIKSGNGNKYLDVSYSSSSYMNVTDNGYKQGVHTISTNSLYQNSTNSDLRNWLNSLGYKMYATVYFTQKEKQDGYQYIQILADDALNYDANDPNGNVDTPSKSLYKACFILSYSPSGSVMEDDHYQFFPHRYDYVDKDAENADNVTHHEFDYDNSHLYNQKFQSDSYRSNTSGSLVLGTTVNDLNIRFDAAGSGGDTWCFKNLKVRLALVDATAPAISSINVAPGKHAHGNTFYVSVAFNEIVMVTGTPKLTTAKDWGDLTYVAGSGTNVLTFSGSIGDNASGNLQIVGWSGTITDLAGNTPNSSAFNTSNLCSLDDSYNFTITYELNGGSEKEGTPKNYTYDTPTFTLVNPTRKGYTFAGWTGSNGNTPETTVAIVNHSHGDKNYIANWTANHYFVRFIDNPSDGIFATGNMSDQEFTYDEEQALTPNAFKRTGYTFIGWNSKHDGSGTTYSNCEIVKNLNSINGAIISLYAQWSFYNWLGYGSKDSPYLIRYPAQILKLANDVNNGITYSGTYFKLETNIDMAGVTFNGIGNDTYSFCGTFDGNNKTIRNVFIKRLNQDNVGIFNQISSGTVKNLFINGASVTGSGHVGILVGNVVSGTNPTKIENCVVQNSSVNGSGSSYVGIIAGSSGNNSSFKTNYYRNCTHNETTEATNVGIGDIDNAHDTNDVRSVHRISMLDNNITASGKSSIVLDDITYYASNSTVTLGYKGEIDEGYSCFYIATKGTLNGKYLTMPASNTIISVKIAPDFAQWWHADDYRDGTSEERAYVISTPTGLNLLARQVNEGNTYNKTFFKLNSDIKYDPNNLDANGENYTAIGNMDNPFNGTFDGQRHTISGIRVNKAGYSYTDGNQGLFGKIANATIQNVVLSDAIITGFDQVGGIVGELLSTNTVKNCLVLNSQINNTADNESGVIIGSNNSDVTLANNYYYHCSIKERTSNIGICGVDVTNNDGARCLYTISRQRNIRTSAQPVLSYQKTNYYLPGPSITLSHVEGFLVNSYSVKDASNNNIALTNGTTFNMPASDVTITADRSIIPWEGEGSAKSPFLIQYPSQLDLLAQRTNDTAGNYVTQHFKLTNNIEYDPEDLDAEGSNYTPIGNYSRPFEGVFDGNGHSISGIRVARRSNTGQDCYLGLFGNILAGKIRNVILNDARFFGYQFIGSIVGNATSSRIMNCYTTDSVFVWAGYKESQYLGGIVGYLYDSKIEGCINFAQVKDSANSTCKHFGGIVGYVSLSTISHNTVIKSTIAASSNAGAISGCKDNNSHFNNNYYYGAKVIKNANSTWDGIGNGGTNLSGGFADITDNDGAVKTNGIPLSDDHKNTFILRKYYKDGKGSRQFTLTGRRFIVSDKTWNTVCLPFSISESAMQKNAAHLFCDAIVMELDPAETSIDNGVLRLTFKQAKSITAGKPYLIKVVNHLYSPNTSPTFDNGYISAVEPEAVTSNDGAVTFVGQFDPFVVSDGRNDEDYNPTPNNINDIVMLGSNNTLGYSKNPRTLHTFRCHFYVPSGSDKARDFELNFDDGEITSATDTEMVVEFKLDNWYTLDGKKLDSEPTEKGIYIYKGKKVIKK